MKAVNKQLIERYALAVCFISSVMLIVAIGISINTLVKMNVPALALSSWDYEQYQTNNAYWRSKLEKSADTQNVDNMPRPAEDVLTGERIQALNNALTSSRYDNMQQLISALIYVFVAGGAFLMHWQLAAACRKHQANTD